MNFRNLTLYLIASTLVLSACKKDEPTELEPGIVVPSNEMASGEQLRNFFDENQENAIQSFVVDAASPALIQGNLGTSIQFNANSFEDAAGNSITGNVTIELTEILGIKDMIFQNRQTVGNNNGNLFPLVSGGQFNITASQNGTEVFLKPWNNYYVEVEAPNGVDPNMGVFYQDSPSADTMTWVQADSALVWGNNQNGYSAYFDSLNWVNLDYFMNPGTAQTGVNVTVPTGFDNTNCSVFVSFDGLNSVSSIYDYSNGMFNTGPFYSMPVGLDVHFIVIAFINNVPHAAIVPATITNNHSQVIPALTATTQAQLATDIQNLP